MKDTLRRNKKDRIWDIDVMRRVFGNYDLHGHKSFELNAAHLYRVEKDVVNCRRLTLYFFDAPHPYVLEFSSNGRRQCFYELATLLRRSAVMWCPSLCLEGENDVIVDIKGTTFDRPVGTAPLQGDSKITVGRMPYEVIDMWFGTFSMEGKDLPQNDTVLGSFLPKESHEIYVIGVTDVPSQMMGHDQLSPYFLAYIGSANYYVLETTTSSSKKRRTNNALVVICRRSFIVRVSHIAAAEVPLVSKVEVPKGHCSAVACALHMNEASVGIMLVNAKHGSLDVNTRTACIRTLLSTFPFGDLTVDVHSRFDYMIIGGRFGYGGDFTPKDPLLAQIQAENLMSDMVESEPSHALSNSLHPMRVFTHARPRVSRLDVNQYATSRALPSTNVYTVLDVFCPRPFLSIFGEAVPSVQLMLSGLKLTGARLPSVGKCELHVTGDFFENSPLVFPLVYTNGSFELVDCELPVVYPWASNGEFLRLQSLTFSILGQLDSVSVTLKSVIASGVFPLKKKLVLAERTPFQVPMYFQTCKVGSVSGSLLTIFYEKNYSEVAALGYAKERFVIPVHSYENEVRGQDGMWTAALYSKDHIYNWSSADVTVEQRRENFELPDPSTWKWLSEWCVQDYQAAGEGWIYAQECRGPYHLEDSQMAVIRRRRWTRLMQAEDPISLHKYLAFKIEHVKAGSTV
ncbi:Unc104-like kinesin [Strigomonas culicis]|uniref:Unc104-like kinesin n=1 Tax=Strigomonas culicis TaxID=28005 RepID=S9UYR2_9TRYP|nr:Unc104-like kinesin [Strigomonas culicis]|eukprot:EPY33879.1 Unc104-like kinesin [Strigomonas culicis]